MTEAMKGITMMASTMPAVSMPMPNGGPLNRVPTSGRLPRWALRKGMMCVPMTGTNTNRPHMP